MSEAEHSAPEGLSAAEIIRNRKEKALTRFNNRFSSPPTPPSEQPTQQPAQESTVSEEEHRKKIVRRRLAAERYGRHAAKGIELSLIKGSNAVQKRSGVDGEGSSQGNK